MAAYTYDVLYDFTAEDEGELTVFAGDIVYYFANGAVHPEGWILVENSVTRESGFVPEAYVQFLRDGGPSDEKEEEQEEDEHNAIDAELPTDKKDNMLPNDEGNETMVVAYSINDGGGVTQQFSGGEEVTAVDDGPTTDHGAMTLGSLNGLDNENDGDNKGDLSEPNYQDSMRNNEIIDHNEESTAFSDSPDLSKLSSNANGQNESSSSSDTTNNRTTEVAPRKNVGFAEVEETQEFKPYFEESKIMHRYNNDDAHDNNNKKNPAVLNSQKRNMTGKPITGSAIMNQIKPSPRASPRISPRVTPSASPQSSPRSSFKETPPQSSTKIQEQQQRGESPPPVSVTSSASSGAFEEYKSAVQKKKITQFKPSIRASPRSSFAPVGGVVVAASAVGPRRVESATDHIITTADSSSDVSRKPTHITPTSVVPAKCPIRVNTEYSNPPTASTAGAASRSTSPYNYNTSITSSNTNIGARSPASLPPMQLNPLAPLKPSPCHGSSSAKSNNSCSANTSTNVFSSRGLLGPTTPIGNLNTEKKKYQYTSSASVAIPILSVSFEHGGLDELISETEQIFQKLEARQVESTSSLLKSLDDVVDGAKQTLNVSK